LCRSRCLYRSSRNHQRAAKATFPLELWGNAKFLEKPRRAVQQKIQLFWDGGDAEYPYFPDPAAAVSPLADLIMILGLFGSHPEKMLVFYVAFLMVDFLVGIIAFRMEKEKYYKLLYLIPQRFIWRQLMYYILFKSIRKALKGELGTWGVLKRTGNVKMKKGELIGDSHEPPM
jgi:hypothetical protein